eukprot:Skav225237  [mRNA]  locus=scaffold2946:243021:248383:+ [translate_table: standard]
MALAFLTLGSLGSLKPYTALRLKYRVQASLCRSKVRKSVTPQVKLVEADQLMKMHPVVILMAVTFFGFIWGPTGMLLAVPLVAYFKERGARDVLAAAKLLARIQHLSSSLPDAFCSSLGELWTSPPKMETPSSARNNYPKLGCQDAVPLRSSWRESYDSMVLSETEKAPSGALLRQGQWSTRWKDVESKVQSRLSALAVPLQGLTLCLLVLAQEDSQLMSAETQLESAQAVIKVPRTRGIEENYTP